MAPGRKRPRSDRPYQHDEDRNSRPSPHRPQNLSFTHGQQHPQHYHQQQQHQQQQQQQQQHQQQYQQQHQNQPQNQHQNQHQHQYQHHQPYHQQQQQMMNSPRGGGGDRGSRRQSRNSGRGGSSVPQSPNVPHASPSAMFPPANTHHPSKPAPATPTASAPPSEPSTPTPTREVPDSNEYLTQERVAHWTADARSAVIQAAVSARREGDVFTLSVVYHEIIEASIDRSMSAAELGSIVRDIVAAPAGELLDPVATFLDTVSSLTNDKEKQPLVRQLLIATETDVSRIRSELESEALINLGLVRTSFPRMAVRKATHALYRQSNYNLLREETEGYSKLMTEYFTTVNNEPPSQEVVSETYQRINALIGAFDMDIGRVLDVTLDVFANLLVKHGKFFVKLLRSSAWWPELRGLEGIEWEEPDISTLPTWAQPESPLWYCSEQEKADQLQLRDQRDRAFWKRVGELGERAGIQAFFELGARRIVSNNRPPDQTLPAEGAALSKQQAARKWADEWMSQTKTLPPPSNDTAAQLLGFKLQFYASDAREPHDFLPDNLMYLAALLIKIGFISILDLYPHLYPLDEDMPAHRDKLLKAKKEKEEKARGRSGNALAMAAALPDETPSGFPAVNRLRETETRTSTKPESERSTSVKPEEPTEKKPTLPEPADQKFQLLKSLLCIGALPEALFILGRHPWMLDVYPELPDFVFRLAHHSLSKVYEAARPVLSENTSLAFKGAGARVPSRPSDYVPRRTLRWAKPDKQDAGDGVDYKFYWEDWIDNVPVCQEVDDVFKLCTSLLGLIGPECGRDIVLLTKLARIARKDLVDDPSDANRNRWVGFSITFLAPALSFTGMNPGVVNEVWELFKQFNTATRYTIYQQWFSSTKPAMRALFKDIRDETNHLLNRVSAGNTKEYGRKIAKISYSSPGVVLGLIVIRLVKYPNMIETLVECSRYLTLLGYDCLTWTLVNFFMNPNKGGTQDDGMLSSSWLRNIASFVGKAYQKYTLMDPTPVLQFTTHQLLRPEGELFMLDVLEQMITSMGGIGLSGSLSESMVLALCAGPYLRTYTLQHHLSDKRHQAASSARRLVKCLKETGLAPQILIALAQQIEAYVHRVDQQDAPDKVVLFNTDKLRSSFFQYLELLRSYIPTGDFEDLFPSLTEMMAEFGVQPDVAFTVVRASIAAKANAFRSAKQSVVESSATDGDVSMSGVDKMPTEDDANSGSGASGEDTSTANKDSETKTAGASIDVDMEEAEIIAIKSSPVEALNPEIENVVEQLKTVLPNTYANHPCLSFYVTFWQLSLPDVDNVGIQKQYLDLIASYESQLSQPMDRRGYNPRIPKADTDKQRRARAEIPKLKEEEPAVTKANALIHDHLQIEMLRWFDGFQMMDPRSDALYNSLLQDCFIPRSRMSLQDAQFASSMLKFMHKSGVPGFRTIKLLDLLFNANKLTCIIRMYSDDESTNFGRFLGDILRELNVWHENKNDAYVKSAHGSNKKLPGFGRRFDSDRNSLEHLEYQDFCKLLYKWHKSLFTALKCCIDSGNYMEIRNSINVLKAVSPSFPMVNVMANELRQPIEHMALHDARADLKVTATSILGVFKNGEKLWQTDSKFRNVPEPPLVTNGANQSSSEKANTPQPSDASVAKLNATAPTFDPKTDTNGFPKGSVDKLGNNAQRRPVSTPATPAPPSREREPVRPTSRVPEVKTPANPSSLQDRMPNKPGAPVSTSHSSSVPPRPDNRNMPAQHTSGGRPSHTLPIRPDSQPPRPRQPERPGSDRPHEYGSHGRHDPRAPNDYGRLDRPGDSVRDREASPGRRPLPGVEGRTPERLPPVNDRHEWTARNSREYDDRTMRAPPRDARGPPVRPLPTWDSRDARDSREQRERGHPPPPHMENSWMHPNSSMSQDYPPHRRDIPLPNSHQGPDRSDRAAPRPAPVTPSSVNDGPMVNPARAALISQQEYGRQEIPNPDRDNRRDRGSHPESPRRVEEQRRDDRRVDERGPPVYHGRNDIPREHREERGPPYLPNRDRRDEPAGTPTGPRGGRNEAPQMSSRNPREMFQPSQLPRSSGHQAQDPNYGRLNQPADPIPSGPRSERPYTPAQPPIPTPPSGPAVSHAPGIHPSRLENIQRPPGGPGGPSGLSLQTNIQNVPSGPRGPTRPPQVSLPSPISRGPPTGPSAPDRVPRGSENRNALRAINSVLTQSAPSDKPSDRNPPPQHPHVRGRGATRANGAMDELPETTSPMAPPSHASTPNSRVETQQSRSGRTDNPPIRVDGTPHEEPRSESRSHRDHRRSERSGGDRVRSPDRSDKRPDERSNRSGPTDRPEGQERGSDRERGREKKGSDRESSRRGHEREGERSARDPERPAREPRESRDSRRERGSREDGRTSGRDERDRRSRGGGSGSVGSDDRKRVRDPADQPHGDMKRRR